MKASEEHLLIYALYLLKKRACSVDTAKQKLLDKMPYKPGVWLQKTESAR